MNSKKNSAKITFFVLLALGIAILFFSKPFSDSLSQFFPQEVNKIAQEPILTEDSSSQGSVSRRRNKELEFQSYIQNTPIFHLDTLIVENNSYLILKFASGYVIKLKANSKVILEYWDPEDTSTPIYINFSRGDYELIKKGIRGQMYVVKNQSIFIPGRRPQRALPIINITLPPVEDKNALIKPKELEAPEPIKKISQPEAQEGERTTLTDYELTQVVSHSAPLFHKCQTKSLREGLPSKGDYLIRLVILPQGRVKEASIVQTNIENLDLRNCTLDIFKRMKFKKFSGQAFETSIPLKFE